MSIPHFEDLPPRKLLEVLHTFWDYKATEKLDGSQLLFGIDEHGFYTSRETKGGLRIYDVNDYDVVFQNTYIRSAHIALEDNLELLKDAGLGSGCQIEIEVLYGEFPNAVQYSEDKNFIIFLRAIEGHVNIDNLKVKLEGQSLTVPLIVPFTKDGNTIEYKEVSNYWEFAAVPDIVINSLQDHINLYAGLIESILTLKCHKTNLTFLEILETPLNKRPEWLGEWEWSEVKEYLADTKIYINGFLKERIEPLKEILLDKIIRCRYSAFGPEDGWIEGVVFSKQGHMFKLIDKEVFLKVKDFYWKERNELFDFSSVLTLDSDIQLGAMLDKYEKEKSTFKTTVSFPKGNRQFIYTPTIDSRTKEIYASLRRKIETTKQDIR